MKAMDIVIKEYRPPDKPELIELMEILQDFLAGIDPLHRMHRLPEYGELYTKGLLQRMSQSAGVIYIAKQGQKALGCITGNIEEFNAEQRTGTSGVRTGHVLELVVREDCRGKGIGKMLMQKMEDYFKSQGCDIVRIEVFVPNASARRFYNRLQYHDRVVDVVKLI